MFCMTFAMKKGRILCSPNSPGGKANNYSNFDEEKLLAWIYRKNDLLSYKCSSHFQISIKTRRFLKHIWKMCETLCLNNHFKKIIELSGISLKFPFAYHVVKPDVEWIFYNIRECTKSRIWNKHSPV